MAAKKGDGLLMVYSIATAYIRNLYRRIDPPEVPPETAQADMAPVILVGRMSVPEGVDENHIIECVTSHHNGGLDVRYAMGGLSWFGSYGRK